LRRNLNEMHKKVCILDYGAGNVNSVYNIFKMYTEVNVSNNLSIIKDSTHIVLPGVGAFETTVEKIIKLLPIDDIRNIVFNERKPFLGICIGMHVLATTGFEFGEHPGLGWIQGRVEKLDPGGMPLPHIGWNNIICKKKSSILKGLESNPDFYFVHSYVFKPYELETIVATSFYGEEFCSIIQYENIFGVQFHPEKSQKAGIKLVENFLSVQ